MREILFRAKDRTGILYHSWLYGSLDNLNEDFWFITYKDRWGNKITADVDINTVGQYTGLTDKNGKKIFEGDIVRQQTFHKLPLKYESEKEKKDHKRYLIKKCGAIFDDEEHYHKNYEWVVSFEEARFYPFADDNFEWGSFDWDIPFEVIGNIHDNPELLKGVQE